jgi:hypothetical protein
MRLLLLCVHGSVQFSSHASIELTRVLSTVFMRGLGQSWSILSFSISLRVTWDHRLGTIKREHATFHILSVLVSSIESSYHWFRMLVSKLANDSSLMDSTSHLSPILYTRLVFRSLDNISNTQISPHALLNSCWKLWNNRGARHHFRSKLFPHRCLFYRVRWITFTLVSTKRALRFNPSDVLLQLLLFFRFDSDLSADHHSRFFHLCDHSLRCIEAFGILLLPSRVPSKSPATSFHYSTWLDFMLLKLFMRDFSYFKRLFFL